MWPLAHDVRATGGLWRAPAVWADCLGWRAWERPCGHKDVASIMVARTVGGLSRRGGVSVVVAHLVVVFGCGSASRPPSARLQFLYREIVGHPDVRAVCDPLLDDRFVTGEVVME
eukprot:scaffold126712_cov26-Tisochrysis_lutea.AAC.1